MEAMSAKSHLLNKLWVLDLHKCSIDSLHVTLMTTERHSPRPYQNRKMNRALSSQSKFMNFVSSTCSDAAFN